jgi:hypothetical protein
MATAPSPRVLTCWKEIANYLGLGVRTVQRYEHEAYLPVRRIPGKARGGVMAFPQDLDRWLQQTPGTKTHPRPTLTSIARETLQGHREAITKLETNLKILQDKVLEGRRIRDAYESCWHRSQQPPKVTSD